MIRQLGFVSVYDARVWFMIETDVGGHRVYNIVFPPCGIPPCYRTITASPFHRNAVFLHVGCTDLPYRPSWAREWSYCRIPDRCKRLSVILSPV